MAFPLACLMGGDYHTNIATTLELSYLDLKHALPRETRANLAKLLYELTIIPGMDSALVEIWANACVRLIK